MVFVWIFLLSAGKPSVALVGSGVRHAIFHSQEQRIPAGSIEFFELDDSWVRATFSDGRRCLFGSSKMTRRKFTSSAPHPRASRLSHTRANRGKDRLTTVYFFAGRSHGSPACAEDGLAHASNTRSLAQCGASCLVRKRIYGLIYWQSVFLSQSAACCAALLTKHWYAPVP